MQVDNKGKKINKINKLKSFYFSLKLKNLKMTQIYFILLFRREANNQ